MNGAPKQTLLVSEQVEARLLLRIEATGKEHEPTDDELETLGYISRQALYERRKLMLAALGDDEETPLSELRYFLEYLTDYRYEPPEEAIEGVRAILKWDRSAKNDPEEGEPY